MDIIITVKVPRAVSRETSRALPWMAEVFADFIAAGWKVTASGIFLNLHERTLEFRVTEPAASVPTFGTNASFAGMMEQVARNGAAAPTEAFNEVKGERGQ